MVSLSFSGCSDNDAVSLAYGIPVVENEGEAFDPYALNEVYFNDSTTLNFNVRVIQYMNGGAPIPREAIAKRIDIMSNVFEESQANIKFSLKEMQVIKGRPEEEEIALEAITLYETMQTLQQKRSSGSKKEVRREDLRSYFILDQMNFWRDYFGHNGFLNIHIVNDTLSNMVAYAADIGAIHVFMRIDALNPAWYTLEHEIGHALGLYHTHQADTSKTGLTFRSGDRVSDTPKTAPLHVYMDPREGNCFMRQNWTDLHRASYSSRANEINDVDFIGGNDEMLAVIQKNIMSYVSRWCREEFTPRQVKRMRKIIEGSQDLREAIEEYERYKYLMDYRGIEEIDIDSLKTVKKAADSGFDRRGLDTFMYGQSFSQTQESYFLDPRQSVLDSIRKSMFKDDASL